MTETITIDPIVLYDRALADKQILDQKLGGDRVKIFFEEFGTREEFARKMGLTIPVKNSK